MLIGLHAKHGLRGDAITVQLKSVFNLCLIWGPALAWRLTSTRPSSAGLVIGAKGFTSPGLLTWGSSGRATSRRGLGVVWPEKDPS